MRVDRSIVGENVTNTIGKLRNVGNISAMSSRTANMLFGSLNVARKYQYEKKIATITTIKTTPMIISSGDGSRSDESYITHIQNNLEINVGSPVIRDLIYTGRKEEINRCTKDNRKNSHALLPHEAERELITEKKW
jgi:hypothetical protein